MFAGAVEYSSRVQVSDSLKRQALRPDGLAGIPFDDSELWVSKGMAPGVTLVQQRQWNTAESKQEQGIVCDPETATKILSWSRIDNRDELLDKLAPGSLSDTDQRLLNSDAGLILVGWKHWRESVCEHLVGDFAFAICETGSSPGSETLFLARDPLGVKPLYVYRDENSFVFATSLAVISNCQALNLEYSNEWLARYVLDCAADWVITAYQAIEKIPPGHFLCFRNGEVQKQQYFQFQTESLLELASEQAYVDEYLGLFRKAVRARITSEYGLASELSGGLDSSSVAIMAAREMQAAGASEPLQTYGIVRSEDEPACIDAVKQAIGNTASRLFGKGDLAQTDFKSLEADFIRTLGTPVEQGIATAHHLFYQDARKRGIRTLLSGFGGDEFTTTYASLVLLELWKKGEYPEWLKRFRGGWLTSRLRALKWLLQRCSPKSGSLTSQYLARQASERWRMSPVSHEVSAKYNLELNHGRFARYDSGYDTLNAFTLNNRWSPAMTARLENCTLMAARYGIEYRWPLLDIRLVNFFLSVPARHKLGPGGLGRYLHRRAMSGLLPAHIIWRDKSMGRPIAINQNGQSSTGADNTSGLPKTTEQKTEKETGREVGKEADKATEGITEAEALNRGIELTALAEILDITACQKLMDTEYADEMSDSVRKGLINRINRLARWLEYKRAGSE